MNKCPNCEASCGGKFCTGCGYEFKSAVVVNHPTVDEVCLKCKRTLPKREGVNFCPFCGCFTMASLKRIGKRSYRSIWTNEERRKQGQNGRFAY